MKLYLEVKDHDAQDKLSDLLSESLVGDYEIERVLDSSGHPTTGIYVRITSYVWEENK